MRYKIIHQNISYLQISKTKQIEITWLNEISDFDKEK